MEVTEAPVSTMKVTGMRVYGAGQIEVSVSLALYLHAAIAGESRCGARCLGIGRFNEQLEIFHSRAGRLHGELHRFVRLHGQRFVELQQVSFREAAARIAPGGADAEHHVVLPGGQMQGSALSCMNQHRQGGDGGIAVRRGSSAPGWA